MEVKFNDSAEEVNHLKRENLTSKNPTENAERKREEHQARWKKWMEERAEEEKLKELGVDLNTRSLENKSEDDDKNSDILRELTLKITQRFENEAPAVSEDRPEQNIMKMEKTIAKEVESNTCPICYELMVPPNYSPILLFPCGHTFCKDCVKPTPEGGRKMEACPYCRKKIQSHAINISLQNLICTYTDNKHLLEKYGENGEKTDEAESEAADQAAENAKFDFQEQYKMYELRCKILQDEKNSIQIEENKLSEDLETQETVVETLKISKEEVLEKIKKLEEEVSLIEKFISKNSDGLDGMRKKINENEIKLATLKETLEPLQEQKEKYLVLMKNSK